MNARELYEQSFDLIGGSQTERRKLLARAASLADAEQDVDLAFTIRIAQVRSSHGATDAMDLLTAYGWCLTKHDEDPERFPIDLWYYKWVGSQVHNFSTVTRGKVNELLSDLKSRFLKAGNHEGAVLKLEISAAKSFHDVDEVERLLPLWLQHKRGRSMLNDCRACDEASESRTLSFLRRDQESVDCARQLIEGKSRCSTEPHSTFGAVLRPLRAVKDFELADKCHFEGLDLIGSDPDYASTFGDHMRHQAITGRLVEGLQLLSRTMPTMQADEANRLGYMRGARLLLAAVDGFDADRLEFDMAMIERSKVDGEAERLATAFDKRNGNDANIQALRLDDTELASQQG